MANTTTTALSKIVNTPFGNRLEASERIAIDEASELANANGCPCGVWERGGWFTVSELAPELIEPDPELSGWRLYAVVDPDEVQS